MSRSRKLTIAAIVVVAVALVVGAAALVGNPNAGPDLPKPSASFCEAAAKYDKKLGTLTGKDKFTKQIELVQPMADHAPKDIKADAELFLSALERRAAGDKSVENNSKVEQAIKNVNRRAVDGCEFYKQQVGSGGV
jgi:hypothetical protein